MRAATLLTELQSSLSGHYISPVSTGYSATIQQPTHSFDFHTSPEQMYVHSHDQPIIAHGQPQQPVTLPNSLQPGHGHDAISVNGYQQSNRRPRIPVSSSGFVPLHSHSTLPSHPSEPTSLPSYNSTSHYAAQPYTSVLPHAPYVQATAPPSFTSQPYQAPQSTPYPHYMPAISMPTPGMPPPAGSYVNPQVPTSQQAPPAGSYVNTQAPMSQQAPPASTHNALYVNGSAPSPPHDQMMHPPHAQAASHIINTGSRPLPLQPQANFGQSQTPSAYAASQGILPQQTGQHNTVSYQPPAPFSPIQAPPPPPPLPPPLLYNTQAYIPDNQPTLPPPPPPPPQPPSDSEQSHAPARRRSSLPRPPINYVQPPPPPPPPLPNSYSQGQPPPPPPPVQNSNEPVQFIHPGPPPKPPVMVDNQSQWLPHRNNLSLQNGYGHIV